MADLTQQLYQQLQFTFLLLGISTCVILLLAIWLVMAKAEIRYYKNKYWKEESLKK